MRRPIRHRRIEQNPTDPFLDLLASDTLRVAEDAQPQSVAKNSLIFGFSSAAVVSALVLIWLAVSGPGFMGYGTSLLWAGLPKGTAKPFYAVQVEPGNRTVRKRSDQMISAHLMGFQAPKVRFFAKYASASQWEQAEMASEPGGTAYQFLIAGVPDPRVLRRRRVGHAGSTWSTCGREEIRVTYHYPGWLGAKDAVEDPAATARRRKHPAVAITTDKPLASESSLDDGLSDPQGRRRWPADGHRPIQRMASSHRRARGGGVRQ